MSVVRSWSRSLAAVVLLSPSAAVLAADGPRHDAVVARLRQFDRTTANLVDHRDAGERYAWLAVHRLNQWLGDSDLADVEAVAVTPEAEHVRWNLGGILALRGRAGAAARVFAVALR